MKHLLPVNTALTLATFFGLLLLPYGFDSLKNFKSLEPKNIETVLDFPLRQTAEDAAAGPLASPANLSELRAKHLVAAAPRNLLDPTHALDHFYEALLRGQGVHIIHYGDSPTTADLITADVRTLFQKEFGDGGIGFVLLARPWAWYGRRGVEMVRKHFARDLTYKEKETIVRNGEAAVEWMKAVEETL